MCTLVGNTHGSVQCICQAEACLAVQGQHSECLPLTLVIVVTSCTGMLNHRVSQLLPYSLNTNPLLLIRFFGPRCTVLWYQRYLYNWSSVIILWLQGTLSWLYVSFLNGQWNYDEGQVGIHTVYSELQFSPKCPQCISLLYCSSNPNAARTPLNGSSLLLKHCKAHVYINYFHCSGS
jgi:hypothetical protein